MSEVETINSGIWGQKEPLNIRIFDLIRKYKAETIVKEILQNADDAKATCCMFLLDEQELDSRADTFLESNFPEAVSGSIRDLYGPGLYAFNDAEFSDEDFEKLSGMSVGHKADETESTGRFGQGFNSVFSITKSPVILSQDKALFVDSFDLLMPGAVKTRNVLTIKELCSNGADFFKRFKHFPIDLNKERLSSSAFFFPFTSPDIRSYVEDKAGKNRGTCKPFHSDHCKKIFEDSIAQGEELMLFLKNIHELSFVLVDKEGGVTRKVTYKTKNRNEVDKVRSKFVQQRRGYVEQPDEWDDEPNIIPYKHEFEIIDQDKAETQSWYLARGSVGTVKLNQFSKKLGSAGMRAVVPFVGAAWSSLKMKGESGHLYFGLPLPIKSLCNFNVDSFFLVDSSRSQLITSENLEEDPEHAWNQEIIKSASSLACAVLIGHLVRNEICSLEDVLSKYDDARDYHEQALPPNIYKHLWNIPCIRCGASNQLVRPSDVSLLPNKLQKLRKELIGAGADTIPCNKINSDIQNGFKSAGCQLKQLDAPFLCAWLKTFEYDSIQLSEVDQDLLNDSANVHCLLEFCLENSYSKLAGLPLAITHSGMLRKFGTIFWIGTKEEVELLDVASDILLSKEMIDLFEDYSDLIDEINQGQESILRRLDHQETIQLLIDYKVFVEIPTGTSICFDSFSKDESWLCSFLDYLYSATSHEADSIRNDLEHVPIILDAQNRLWPINKKDLFLPSFDLKPCVKELHKNLSLFDGISTYGTSAEFQSSLINCKDILGLQELSPNHLLRLCERKKNFDEPSAEMSVNYFANSDFDEDFEFDRLKSIPMFLSVDGALISIDGEETYISAPGFDPIKLETRGDILILKRKEKRGGLYKKCGIPELNLFNYLQRTLVPAFSDFDDKDNVKVWKWIFKHNADIYQEIKAEDESGNFADLWSELGSNLKLICQDGKQYSCNSLHEEELAEYSNTFPGAIHIPKYASYGFGQTDMLSLLRALGMSQKIKADHVVSALEKIQESDVTKKTVGVIESIFNYICEHEDILNEPLNDAGYDSFAEWVRNENWLPEIQSAKDLPKDIFIRDEICKLGFKGSDLRDYPDELLWSHDAESNSLHSMEGISKQDVFSECASADSILAFPIKEHFFESGMFKGNHLDTTFPSSNTHAKKLLKFCPEGKLPDSKKQADALRICFLELYYWAGRWPESDFARTLKERVSILDGKGKQLHHPDKIFIRESQKFSLWFSEFYKDADETLLDGIRACGVKDAPELSDLLWILNHVDNEVADQSLTSREPLDKTIKGQLVNVFKQIYRLSKASDSLSCSVETQNAIPFWFNSHGVFCDKEDMLVSDIKDYKDRLKQANWFLEENLDPKFAKFFEITCTSELEDIVVPDTFEVSSSVEIEGGVNSFKSRITNDHFILAAKRLLYHQTGRTIKYADSSLKELFASIEVHASAANFETHLCFPGREEEPIDGSEGKSSFSFHKNVLHINWESYTRQVYISKFLKRQMSDYLTNKFADYSGDDSEIDMIEFYQLLAEDLSPDCFRETLNSMKISDHPEAGQYASENNEREQEEQESSGQEQEQQDGRDNQEQDEQESEQGQQQDQSNQDGEQQNSGPEESDQSSEEQNESSDQGDKEDQQDSERQDSSEGDSTQEEQSNAEENDSDSSQQEEQMQDGELETAEQDSTDDKIKQPETSDAGSQGGSNHSAGSAGSQRSPRKRSSSKPKKYYPQVRVSTGDSSGSSQTEAQQAKNKEVDKAAVEYVLKYERGQGRFPYEQPHDNPGFDIKSFNKEPDDPDLARADRYIEVKGKDSSWHTGYVTITSTQYSKGLAEKNKYWLYVVEEATSVEKKLHRINNPIELIDKYEFDGSWKKLADDLVKSAPVKDKIAYTVDKETGEEIVIGKIIRIRQDNHSFHYQIEENSVWKRWSKDYYCL